ncbi:hypothetical protein PSPO01_08114 [Paraphaeosphaeria sporulosa]
MSNLYLKYPIPIPIPLNLPSGSALLGLTGLGPLISNPTQRSPASLPTSSSLFIINAARGTCSSSPFPNPSSPLSPKPGPPPLGRPTSLFSTMSVRPDDRELALLDVPGSGLLNMRCRSREPSFERRIGISAMALPRRRRRRTKMARTRTRRNAIALPAMIPARVPGERRGLVGVRMRESAEVGREVKAEVDEAVDEDERMGVVVTVGAGGDGDIEGSWAGGRELMAVGMLPVFPVASGMAWRRWR